MISVLDTLRYNGFEMELEDPFDVQLILQTLFWYNRYRNCIMKKKCLIILPDSNRFLDCEVEKLSVLDVTSQSINKYLTHELTWLCFRLSSTQCLYRLKIIKATKLYCYIPISQRHKKYCCFWVPRN